MKKDGLIEKIFSVDFDDDCILALVMNECGEYIENNSREFVSSAIKMLDGDNLELKYDYAEIKDIEYPELEKVEEENDVWIIETKIRYLLDLWNSNNYIGQITAEAKGIFSFRLNGFFDHDGKIIDVEKANEEDITMLKQVLKEFKIIELTNVEEYFDVYIE
jgi:hypothetical protein